MKRTITLFAICFFGFTFLSCGGTTYYQPRPRTIAKEKIINRPYDETWGKAIEWFTTHNTPIKNMDKSSGLITTEYNLSVQEALRYVDCGELETGLFISARFEDTNGNFNLLMKAENEISTKVTINSFFKTKLNQYNIKGELVYSEMANCISNGNLEKEIFNYLSR